MKIYEIMKPYEIYEIMKFMKIYENYLLSEILSLIFIKEKIMVLNKTQLK